MHLKSQRTPGVVDGWHHEELASESARSEAELTSTWQARMMTNAAGKIGRVAVVEVEILIAEKFEAATWSPTAEVTLPYLGVTWHQCCEGETGQRIGGRGWSAGGINGWSSLRPRKRA